jgi:hypothetical protein
MPSAPAVSRLTVGFLKVACEQCDFEVVENRSVMKQGASTATLGVAGDLVFTDGNVAGSPNSETLYLKTLHDPA